jgi:hypothetical protein
MHYIRLLHPKHFDSERNEFKSLAFKNYDGGASVIQRECVDTASPSICDHIRKFYPNTGGDPAIFWIFPEDAIPAGGTLVQVQSESGDDCHHDIVGLSDKQLRTFLKSSSLADLQICALEGARQLKRGDLPAATPTTSR